jgi:hypothetical protein
MIKAASARSLAKKLGLLAGKEQAALALRVMESFGVTTMLDGI